MRTKQNGLGEQGGRRHSVQFWLLPLCIAMICGGCKQEDKGVGPAKAAVAAAATEVDPAGTYPLVTVDGKNVPCTVQHEGHTMTINSGKFIINADGTCASIISLAGRDSPIETKATYTREGPKFTMKWQGAGMTLGNVEGNTFTMNNEGMVFGYRK